MASSGAAKSSSLLNFVRRFLKAPWEITGPTSHPEYRGAVPGALEYRLHCPATPPQQAIVPTSDPEHVFDIKYYTRDCRRNRPPVRRYVVHKSDALRLMAEKTAFNPVTDFPRVYLNKTVEEDDNTHGGGYQK